MDTRFAARSILCALGLVTLGTLSASAFAQSAEYRRGYDQGYRDAMEAQSRQDQRGGPRGHIIIEEAVYGTREGYCNIRESLQEAVGWRRNISIAANNDLCGDPAPTRVKRLDIRYRCGDGPPLRAQAREGGAVTLNCR